jgi:hypothetical protein
VTLVRVQADGVRVEGESYRWEWQRSTDRVVLRDRADQPIATQLLQPYVRVQPAADRGSGRCVDVSVVGHRLAVTYDGVNDGGRLAVRLRFEATYYVLESVAYDSPRQEEVVALYYAYGDTHGAPGPNAEADYYVVPGANQAPEQHILHAWGLANGRLSLGCFGIFAGTFLQQPFLPHYLVAVYSGVRPVGATGPTVEIGRSGAACLGLAAVPDGNVMLEVADKRFSPYLNFRSDLWHFKSGPGALRFDAPWISAIAESWYEAIRGYFRALMAEGYARPKAREAVPVSAYWPEYDTWGDQCARAADLEAFTEDHLQAIYRDFRASGLRARLFVIDAIWEQGPGALEHSAERFPNFEAFLDQVRADGYEVGLWAAFPRCRDYRLYGLDADAVLRTPDGVPYYVHPPYSPTGWYVFDPTHPEAQRHLQQRARALVERYRPKLIKIDFGYEIPTPDIAAPHDLRWAGERLFQKLLEVVVPAIRQADPEVAIQYYALTPLLAAYYDHVSFDDMWLSRRTYHDAFNKRAVLATLCGEFGVVPYGSTGYDWASALDIWFDTPVVGTLGCLAPFCGDEQGDRATPERVAKYNGIARLTRRNPHFRVEFLDAELQHHALGPRAASWARLEDGRPVVVALRPRADRDGVVGDRYEDLVAADCPVVAASLDEHGLAEATRIGLVPYGTGTVRIGRTAERARVTARLFGGGSLELPARREGRGLAIGVQESTSEGTPIELIEVRLE